MGLREILIGENPLEIEYLWNKMYNASNYIGRRGAGIHAISALDIALWDIAGQFYEVPVYTLLGGKHRNKIKAYGTFDPAGIPEENKALVEELLNKGYRNIKLWCGIPGDDDLENDYRILKIVRETVGPKFALSFDVAAKWGSYGNAFYRAKLLEEFDLNWIEEPLPSDDLIGHSKLRKNLNTRISGGETLSTRYEFKDFIEFGHPDIIQPDVTRCGGISEMKKIYDLAQLNSTQLVPHCYSTGILISATIHFLASSQFCDLIEYPINENPLIKCLVKNKVQFIDGFVEIPEEPGLGVILDEEIINKYRIF